MPIWLSATSANFGCLVPCKAANTSGRDAAQHHAPAGRRARTCQRARFAAPYMRTQWRASGRPSNCATGIEPCWISGLWANARTVRPGGATVNANNV